MKTLNNKRPWIWIICIFAVTSFSVQAQTSFTFDQATAQSITGGDYVASINSVTFFSKNNLCFYPLSQQINQPVDWYAFEAIPEATAVLSWGEDVLLLFNGNYYIQYQVSSGQLISDWAIWEGLPFEWWNKLDGVVRWDENNIFFFYGSSYVMYDVNAQTYSEVASLNDWAGWPQSWEEGVDAVINLGDGFIYFLNQGQLISYNRSQQSLSQPTSLASNNFSTLPQNNRQSSLSLPNQKSVVQNSPQLEEVESSTGCLIGHSGEAVTKSKLFGAKKGRTYTDRLPKGSKVAEIRIYTAKAWGKEVIGGVQTIIENTNGELEEQDIIGKKTTNGESIVLQNGECITGVSGTTGSPEDGFVNSITIHTSDQSETTVGNTSGRSFNVDFYEGQFEGFYASFTNNLTAIGVMHTGSSSRGKVASSSTKNQNSFSKTSSGSSGSTVAISNSNSDLDSNSESDLYTADYMDYTSNLADATEWIAQPLPGLDWLGAGFDILRYDPLDPTERSARKTNRSIIVTNSSERAGNAGQNLKPFGTHFSSYNKGSERDSSSWIQSYKQFSNSFNIAASGSVEVPEVASSSLSGSHSEMNSTSVGSESIFMFNTVKRDIHEVALRLFWKQEVTNEYEDGTVDKEIKKYRQKLDPNFVDDVLELPVISGSVPNVKITKRNQVLPANLNLIRQKYLAFINSYGTHFASKVVWGGKYVARTQVKRSDYEKARMSQTDFKNTAEVTIKKVKVGRSVAFGMGESQSKSNSQINFKREVFAMGGNGETDLDKWRDKVDSKMSPVDVSFISMCDVLIEELFPNDPDIEMKREILRIITEQYIWDNYREAKPSRFDFFRPLPDIDMPSNISITNNGGYVMWFTVKYKHNGGFHTKESPNFTLGFSKSIEVPAGATDVTITAEQTTGKIFSTTMAKPETSCYKCWGTIFSTGWGKCDE